MSGIDKIIQQIESDTKAYCDEIIDNARIKADAVVNNANDQAVKIRSSYEEKTARTLGDIASRAKSSAALEEKKAYLNAKQSVINEMVSAALAKAKNLPDDEYFSLITKMIEKNSQDDRGVIYFGQRDLSRLPVGFQEKINKVSKGELVISQEALDIDSGFILAYGGIEENCSFDAICRSKAEELCDKASSLLF